jgi:hypothetical protein
MKDECSLLSALWAQSPPVRMEYSVTLMSLVFVFMTLNDSFLSFALWRWSWDLSCNQRNKLAHNKQTLCDLNVFIRPFSDGSITGCSLSFKCCFMTIRLWEWFRARLDAPLHYVRKGRKDDHSTSGEKQQHHLKKLMIWRDEQVTIPEDCWSMYEMCDDCWISWKTVMILS